MVHLAFLKYIVVYKVLTLFGPPTLSGLQRIGLASGIKSEENEAQ